MGLAGVAACLLVPVAAQAQGNAALDALVRAYPDELAGYDTKDLIWRDGTRMALGDAGVARSPGEILDDGSILDQIAIPYPAGPLAAPPVGDDDPGRIRNRAFFDKMYGECGKGEVTPHLVRVVWLPHSWGHTVAVTSVNGVAAQLDAVSHELDALPEAEKRVLYPPGGTYTCRSIAGTQRPSMHGWGAAIDINTAYAEYWRWRGGAARPAVERIAFDVVRIFEKHGFIWGGKWAHYDTMHFEYRPELLGATFVAQTAIPGFDPGMHP